MRRPEEPRLGNDHADAESTCHPRPPARREHHAEREQCGHGPNDADRHQQNQSLRHRRTPQVRTPPSHQTSKLSRLATTPARRQSPRRRARSTAAFRQREPVQPDIRRAGPHPTSDETIQSEHPRRCLATHDPPGYTLTQTQYRPGALLLEQGDDPMTPSPSPRPRLRATTPNARTSRRLRRPTASSNSSALHREQTTTVNGSTTTTSRRRARTSRSRSPAPDPTARQGRQISSPSPTPTWPSSALGACEATAPARSRVAGVPAGR